ncbi:MAG: hypothetical protein QG671_316 [Actinomycetota bacterium]|nr:hypothetical protein [Actinomycetota bacterium]
MEELTYRLPVRKPSVRPLPTASGLPVVYTLPPVPSGAPISILRLGSLNPAIHPAMGTAHAHDFLVIAYFDRPGGSVGSGDGQRPIEAGDVFVVAPGEVVRLGDSAGPGRHVISLGEAEGWTVFFPPEVLGVRAAGTFLGWHTHPLLHPFVGGTGRIQHLNLAPPSRATWSERLATLDTELRERREGYRESATALLTLILVDLARALAHQVPAAGAGNDSLLARAFGVIDERYREELSLRDVARAVGLTPEYLTTVVRQRTGRTVGAWITERRMTEARALLAGTDLPVARIAVLVGYPDPAYFARVFRRAHGDPPRSWRRAAAV